MAAGDAVVSATYQGRTGLTTIAVRNAERDALPIAGGGMTGQLKVGNVVSVSMDVQYSVVSGDRGEIDLRLSDQHGVLGSSELLMVTAPTFL